MFTSRDLTAADIDQIADYWLLSDPEYLIGLGVDVGKLPDRESMKRWLEFQLSLPNLKKVSYCKIWEVDSLAIGHCNINNIVPGRRANMHLHIWDAAYRKSGIGFRLLRESIRSFFEEYDLSELICEPYALNAAPNKVLEKLGFVNSGTYIATPGEICFEQPVNRWVLTKAQLSASDWKEP